MAPQRCTFINLSNKKRCLKSSMNGSMYCHTHNKFKNDHEIPIIEEVEIAHMNNQLPVPNLVPVPVLNPALEPVPVLL